MALFVLSGVVSDTGRVQAGNVPLNQSGASPPTSLVAQGGQCFPLTI